MKEVYPGIFSIREKGKLGVIKPPENVYILAGKNGLIFDAGYGNIWTIKHLLKEFKKIKKFYRKKNKIFNITRVLPSHVHPDHFSGLKRLRKYLGVQIILTKKMAQIIKDRKSFFQYYESADPLKEEYQVKTMRNLLIGYLQKTLSHLFFKLIYGLSFIKHPNIIIQDKTKININGEQWDIFPSPGHSPDHISLYNEDNGVLFSGDNILRTITTWLGPPNSDIDQYINSIKKIQNLPNLKLILPAHGSPIKDPKNRIKEILSHRNERTDQVFKLIQEHPKEGITPNEIIKALYPQDGKFKQGVARGWCSLTLNMLSSQNHVYYVKKDKEIRFYPC
jgi:glyoxylase-like metal-dependent hydrolase (beta-lactamase superfamily II)